MHATAGWNFDCHVKMPPPPIALSFIILLCFIFVYTLIYIGTYAREWHPHSTPTYDHDRSNNTTIIYYYYYIVDRGARRQTSGARFPQSLRVDCCILFYRIYIYLTDVCTNIFYEHIIQRSTHGDFNSKKNPQYHSKDYSGFSKIFFRLNLIVEK